MDVSNAVEELGNETTSEGFRQPFPLVTDPSSGNIYLIVLQYANPVEQSTDGVKLRDKMETGEKTSPVNEDDSIVYPEEAESVVNVELGNMDQTKSPSPNKVPLTSLRIRTNRPPMIDVETNDVSSKMSPITDVGVCVSNDEAQTTVCDKTCQTESVKLDVESNHVKDTPVKPKYLLENSLSKLAIRKSTMNSKEDESVVDDSAVLLNESAIACSLCFKVLPSKLSLCKHLLWHLLVKNSNIQFIDHAAEEFEFDGINTENKSFEELLDEGQQHLSSNDGIYCRLCFKNFELHYDSAQMIDLVDFSTSPKCVKCHEEFNEATVLEIHIRQHLSAKPYGCCICKEVFVDVLAMKLHMLNHVFHTYSKFFQCRYCRKLFFNEIDNDLHEADHVSASNLWKFSYKAKVQGTREDQGPDLYKNKPIDNFFNSLSSSVCDLIRKLPSCGSAFEVMEEVTKFSKSETTSCSKKLLLDGELTALTSVINLTKEVGTLLDEQSLSRNRDASVQMMAYNQVLSSAYSNIINGLYNQRFCCNFCGKSLPDLEKLCFHIDKFHEDQGIHACEDCNKEFDCIDSLFKHRNTHKEFHLHKCPVCNMNFNYKFDVIQHLKVHFAGALKRCPKCGVRYNFQHELVRHLQTHNEIQPFLDKCKDCNSFFAGIDQLKKHNRRTHSVKRLYDCSFCNKRFSRQNIYLLHVKGHIRNKFRKSLKGMNMYRPCLSSKKKVSSL